MALKKSQLYSKLWQSCDELRGGMDALGDGGIGLALGVLQVGAGAEGVGVAGEDHHGGFHVVLEAFRRAAQLAHGLGGERVGLGAAVEPHQCDAAVGAEAALDGDEAVGHHATPSP